MTARGLAIDNVPTSISLPARFRLTQPTRQKHPAFHRRPFRTSITRSSAMHFPPPRHLISKWGDPIFALGLGIASAAVRIRREESEKVLGRYTLDRIPWAPIVETGKRRASGWWEEARANGWSTFKVWQ
ncbi:hypothetical protein BJ508DRAFT_55406 [Ascobolus immersus RN42]|uniref:Uncharacterized protein n=1 Tax=Ascobolus immersus RN42 TaxID=1160509 RepID=A0A3N4IBX3_ASCIM|nr:hypothetical protein BJ508DRAFT_55406 [Ascobolus immersus RN42]